MIKIHVTNAEVITFYKSNEVLKIRPSKKEGSQTKVASFNIKTRDMDTGISKKFHFKPVTVFCKNDEQVKALENIIKPGAIIEFKGRYTTSKNEKDEKYYDQLIADGEMFSITQEKPDEYINNDDVISDEDLPF